MLRNMDLPKWIALGVLMLHIAWIGNHMRWVANDQINPWRLGGYAMYTVPSGGLRTLVYDASMPDQRLPANMQQHDEATRFTNYGRTFRCADVPAKALLAFFDENRTLIGRNVVFVYTERQFIRAPPSTKRVMQGTVALAWQDERTFIFTSRFCGGEHTESATLPGALFGNLP